MHSTSASVRIAGPFAIHMLSCQRSRIRIHISSPCSLRRGYSAHRQRDHAVDQSQILRDRICHEAGQSACLRSRCRAKRVVFGRADRSCVRGDAAAALCAIRDRFRPLMSFRGRRRKTAVVLTTRRAPQPLCDLRNDLRARLAGIGVGAPRGFTPHMTLGYSEMRIAETPVAPVGWSATAIYLLHSFHGQARHEVLATIPLDG